ncbi:serum response factor-binding protein 1 [Stigmatopora nigra]
MTTSVCNMEEIEPHIGTKEKDHIGEETPIVDETLIGDKTPIGEEAPIEDETPIVDETPIGEETPVGYETPIEDETPIGDLEGDQEEAKQDVTLETKGEVEVGEQEETSGDSEADIKAEDCNDEEKNEDEETKALADQPEKKPDKVEPKVGSGVLNLNNEVVDMRKEVRRVRTLVIRKLVRQMAALNNKKGTEPQVEKNKRRAARILEEIHALKKINPDHVTKSSLQNSFNFNRVCQDPKYTMSDRAIARIGSHPQFRAKIEKIQASIKDFCEEREKDARERKEKVKKVKKFLDPWDEKMCRAPETKTLEKRKELTTDDDEMGSTHPDEYEMEPAQFAPEKKLTAEFKSLKKKNVPKEKVKKKPQAKTQVNKPKVPKQDEESDLDLSDDDKSYFDDSTEERFKKQSSQEDSDNDFFVGKVRKFKKSKTTDKGEENKEESEPKSKPALETELDELESRLKQRGPKLNSLFCSLSQDKSMGGMGKPFGRGRAEFQEHGKFQRGEQSTREHRYDRNEATFRGGDRGDDRRQQGWGDDRRQQGRGDFRRQEGRGDFRRQPGRGGSGGFSRQEPEQALHPSWQASKKRKEQGKILPFRGKKIKFDD